MELLHLVSELFWTLVNYYQYCLKDIFLFSINLVSKNAKKSATCLHLKLKSNILDRFDPIQILELVFNFKMYDHSNGVQEITEMWLVYTLLRNFLCLS